MLSIEIAEEKGLAQFHDRKGTYCEISREYEDQILNKHVWRTFRHLEEAWDGQHWDSDSRCEISILLWVNLQGVTVRGHEEKPIRRLKPWG